ncbi:MAG: Murein DD-endopeptidase MepM [Firmicutes bacterium ADurb.Bin193]|nr:MAG: Murein DD-endopeptidase MepM [Firmicutes bacterium ADurb.Bin193]
MFYGKKTGRLIFEVADVMTTRRPAISARRNIIAVAETKTQRPKTAVKPNPCLEKNLSKYKIGFAQDSGRLIMKRLFSMGEFLGYIRKAAMYPVALLCAAILVYGSVSAVDLHFAREAIIGSKPVGVISNVAEFEKLVLDMQNSLSITLGKEVAPPPKPVYIARLVFGKSLTSNYTLRQNILSTFDEVEEGYAVYVNDVLVCAGLDEKSVNNALERVKTKYKEDITGATVEFVDNVSVRKEFIPIGYLRSEDGIYSALTTTNEGTRKYVVTEKDTLWGIARKYGMSVDDLYSMNENLKETIHAGDEIIINKSSPVLSVRTTYIYEGERPIPYETKEKQDSSMASGSRKVVVAGIEGKKYVVEEIVKINGDEVEHNVKSEKLLSEPVAAEVRVGTKSTRVAAVASGKFSRPVYGTISSRFGNRSRGWHSGLDIAAPTGTPIKAADSGTVIYSGWEGAYGYLVKINHSNGYVTYYAHCSALLVKSGQKVSKGDTIAKVGNTGRSTGPHCHFEVRKNGTPQNPASYLGL